MSSNFVPYIYNNRQNQPNNVVRPSYQPNYGSPYQIPNNSNLNKPYQPSSIYQEGVNSKNLNKTPYQQQQLYNKVSTQGTTTPLQKNIPQIQSSINNFNSRFQPQTYLPTQVQQPIDRNNPSQLFKSSIYQIKSNTNTRINSEKSTLNESGGNNKNIGINSTPKRLPRASEPNMPTDLFMQQTLQKNNQQSHSNNIPEQHNFTKIKNNMTNSPIKEEKKVEYNSSVKQQSSGNYHQGMRRSSVDIPEYSPHMRSRTPTGTACDLTFKRKRFKVSDFFKIKELGAGKYGKVFLVIDKGSGFICALKVIEKKLLKEQEITQQFIRQLKIQIFLNHPHIIKMYGYFDDLKQIYIILEVGTGGQLFHQLKRNHQMAQAKVAGYMRQVCDAVRELHSLQIIHRDIKPENIVLHENIVKLCDFGWSVHQDKSLRTTFCGTPLYVCPQILKGKDYNQKIDIWSLGIMMYEMLVGENPFKITKQEELIKIIKEQIVIPDYITISDEARNFLQKCLQKNPNDRITIRELIQHKFFKKYPQKNTDKKMGGFS